METAALPPPQKKRRFSLSPLNKRRWSNFKRNRRAFWSLWIFLFLFVMSLFAEFLANDKPIIVSYRGELRMPIFIFYSERDFGGDFRPRRKYKDIEVKCLIQSGGVQDCFDDPEGIISGIHDGVYGDGPEGVEPGWLIWPPIPYSYNTIVDIPGVAPSPPDENNWLGTDDTKRDVTARVIYRIPSVDPVHDHRDHLCVDHRDHSGCHSGLFRWLGGSCVPALAGIWGSTPSLYVIIILFAILGRSFWLLGVFDHSVRLACPGGCCSGGVPAGRVFRICPCRQGAGRQGPHHHVPPYAAERHGCDGDDAAVPDYRHHRKRSHHWTSSALVCRPRPLIG